MIKTNLRKIRRMNRRRIKTERMERAHPRMSQLRNQHLKERKDEVETVPRRGSRNLLQNRHLKEGKDEVEDEERPSHLLPIEAPHHHYDQEGEGALGSKFSNRSKKRGREKRRKTV